MNVTHLRRLTVSIYTQNTCDLLSFCAKHGYDPQDIGILLSALKSCSTLRDVETGKKIHSGTSQATLTHIYVANTLVNMYSSCGEISEAHALFQTMQHRNVVSWNTLIQGYVENGESQYALHLFSLMQRGDVSPNSHTFVAVLTACSTLATSHEAPKSFCLEKGKEIHSIARNSGCSSHLFVASALVDMYAKCGSLEDARRVFDSMGYRDVACWSGMIQLYADNERPEQALELFGCMETVPNRRTYVAVVKACAGLTAKEDGAVKVRSLGAAMTTHARVLRDGLDCDIYIASGLVDVYAKCGSLLDARKVFDRMQVHDVVSWTSLLAGCVENGEAKLALELFECMSCRPGPHAFVAALHACACLSSGEEELGKVMDIHSQAALYGYEMNVFVANTLVNVYSVCGSVLDARAVFDRMPFQNIVSYNSILTGYVENGLGEVCLDLFFNMGVTPNDVTYITALTACCLLASLEAGKLVHSEICCCGLESNPYVVNLLVDLYGKSGAMDHAEHVFLSASTYTTSVITWNALFAGYSRQGNGLRVLGLFREMTREELPVNNITLLLALTACSHAGYVDQGLACFDAMVREHRLSPTIEHYHCVIDILSRANRFEEAVKMVLEMPYDATPVTWKTVLSACKKWKNVEVGKRAFSAVVELDKSEDTAYLLMASLYGSVGMSEEQSKVLSMRKDVISG